MTFVPVTVRVPANRREAFKRRFFPSWLLKYFPVKTVDLCSTVRVLLDETSGFVKIDHLPNGKIPENQKIFGCLDYGFEVKPGEIPNYTKVDSAPGDIVGVEGRIPKETKTVFSGIESSKRKPYWQV